MIKTLISICRLCGSNPTLEKSHIIAKFVGRSVKSNTKSIRFSALNEKNGISQDTLKLKFLCEDCEDKFAIIEDKFARQWFYRYGHGTRSQQQDEVALIFYISTAWRVLRYLLEKKSIPIFLDDANATELALRNHLHMGNPAPLRNSYLFLASDFISILGAPPQEYLTYTVGFGNVVFQEEGLLGSIPVRPTIMSVIGPFIHFLELQAPRSVINAKQSEWDTYLLNPGKVMAPAAPPPSEVTAYLRRFVLHE
jgi:hypothetical protein